MTPIQAAQVIATAQVDADAAKRRAAGYTDMLWGLLLAYILLANASTVGNDLGTAGPTFWSPGGAYIGPVLAIGGLVLSFLVTRNQAISLAPPVRSFWFWLGLPILVLVPAFAVLVQVLNGSRIPATSSALWGLFDWWFAFLLGAYVVGRGLFLRSQPWYGRWWALGVGIVLLCGLTAVLLVDLQAPIGDAGRAYISAWSIGLAWFGHGVFLYTRG